MSTHAMIYFTDEGEKEPTVSLFQWWDGNPGCVILSLKFVKDAVRAHNAERGAAATAANYIFLAKLTMLYSYNKETLKQIINAENIPEVVSVLANDPDVRDIWYSYYPMGADEYWNNPRMINANFVYYVTLPGTSLGLQDYKMVPDWKIKVYSSELGTTIYEGQFEKIAELRKDWIKKGAKSDFADYLVKHLS